MNEEKYLEILIDRLKERFNPVAVILTGSRARGDWMPWSDYDVLVIADFDKGYMDRLSEIAEFLKDIPISIEIHPYTFDEAIAMLKRGNVLIYDALEYGKPLYVTKRYEDLKKIFNDLRSKGLVKTGKTIKILKD